MTSDTTRRRLLGATAGLAAGTLAAVPEGAAQGRTIVFNDSGGASLDAANKAFGTRLKAETGIELKVTAPANIARLKTMVDAGAVEWDVAELVSQEHRTAIRQNLLLPLDRSIVDTGALLPDGVDEYAAVFSFYGTAMGYRADRFPAGKRPEGWAQFWDVKAFPGRRAMRNHPVDNLEFALLADGVAPDALYPLDLDRAFRSLDRIKSHVAVWWKDGAQPAQMLVDGEVDFTTGWTGRFYSLFVQGERRIGVSWKGAAAKKSWVGVPRGCKNVPEAMKLIAIMMRPEAGAAYASLISYTNAHPKSVDLLPEETRPWTVTYPANKVQTFTQSEDWWLDNLAPAQERWNNWISA